MNDTTRWFLADDLSGALGIGASFVAAGREVDVIFGTADDSTGSTRAGALLGVSSETRNQTRDQAQAKVASLVRRHGLAGLALKKIDSTLRGPVGAELTAIVRARPGRPLLFTSAAPAAGRTIVDGVLLVDGVPVNETAFARDPKAPVRECRVRAIIEQTGGPEVSEIDLETVRAGGEALRRTLESFWSRHAIASADAETEHDLANVVAAARAVRPDFLPVGSGGVAEAWIRSEMETVRDSTVLRPPTAVGRGETLFVVGSVHPQSRRQLAALQAATGCDCLEVGATDEGAAAAQLAGALDRGRVAILASPLPPIGVAGAQAAGPMAERLGEIVREILHRRAIQTLVVTGGDVARAVFAALGATRVEIVGEIGFGIALGRLGLPDRSPVMVVVKPGGFGDEQAFVRLVRP